MKKTYTYSEDIYGKPTMTTTETVNNLKAENCFSKDGRLAVWPNWFIGANMFEAVNDGSLVRKTYRNCMGHFDLYLPVINA